jgi:hypothetical protein
LGAFLIRHPIFGVAPYSVIEVFWVAVACSFVNLVLVLFVLPESLSEEKQRKARKDASWKGKASASVTEMENTGPIEDAAKPPTGGILESFLNPLMVFLPAPVDVPGRRRRYDWSLTFLACALFGYMLSTVSVYRCLSSVADCECKLLGCSADQIPLRWACVWMGC